MKIQLRSQVPAERVAERLGTYCTEEDYDFVLTGPVSVFSGAGALVAVYVPNAIPEGISGPAMGPLRSLRNRSTDNRGAYAGGRKVQYKKDGTISRSTRSRNMRSITVGFLGPSGGRFPYCRQTPLVRDEPEAWLQVLPMAQHVAGLFEQHVPKRFAAQAAKAAATSRDFVIPGTPYTTMTVNNTDAGCIHTDTGDFKPGFGCISVQRQGAFTGCELVFPESRFAVDMQDGDVLFFDPHAYHGNTECHGEGEAGVDYERISCVYYYRTRVELCGTAAEEHAKAKNRGKL